MSLKNPNCYAWIDCESTGVKTSSLQSEEIDELLELALIITDKNLKIIGDKPFRMIIKKSEAELYNSMAKASRGDGIAYKMHSSSGLWDEIKNGSPDSGSLLEIDDAVLKYIDNLIGEDEGIYFAGNSLRLDMNMVELYLPKLDARSHHRSLDITTFGLLMREQYGDSVRYEKQLNHEALSDILETLGEAKFYHEKLGWNFEV